MLKIYNYGNSHAHHHRQQRLPRLCEIHVIRQEDDDDASSSSTVILVQHKQYFLFQNENQTTN